MAPPEIVGLYARRFKIEVTFKMIKHVIGGFTTTSGQRHGKSRRVSLSPSIN